MAKTVEIPDELHQALEARAHLEGVSISDLIMRELGSGVAKRPLDEILDELATMPPIHLTPSSAEIIRELRGPLPEDDAGR